MHELSRDADWRGRTGAPVAAVSVTLSLETRESSAVTVRTQRRASTLRPFAGQLLAAATRSLLEVLREQMGIVQHGAKTGVERAGDADVDDLSLELGRR